MTNHDVNGRSFLVDSLPNAGYPFPPSWPFCSLYGAGYFRRASYPDHTSMVGPMEHKWLELEYEQINENFRFLADVRFKLLAFVPTLGGAAVFVLSRVGLEAGKAPGVASSELLVVLLIAALGFLATLGITLYDQRNSELYNALSHRAKHLEKEFKVPSAPGGLKKMEFGGQFRERPMKGRRVIFQAAHDVGLALIYGPLLGAWLFPLAYCMGRLGGGRHEGAQAVSAVLAAAAATVFIGRLVAIDRAEARRYREAAEHDGLTE